MKKLHVLVGQCVRKISAVACEFSSIKIYYSVNRINEIYVLLKKKHTHLNFIYSILCNIATVCFAAIELAIVLHGFCDVNVTLCDVNVTLSK